VPLATKTEAFKPSKPISGGNKSIGDLLVACRKERGFTQKEVAGKSGIPRKWVGRWERGRAIPDHAEWSKLAMVLKIPLALPGAPKSLL
jgi:transcriptional regulator with XRE-family HTH domain